MTVTEAREKLWLCSRSSIADLSPADCAALLAVLVELAADSEAWSGEALRWCQESIRLAHILRQGRASDTIPAAGTKP